MKAPTGPWAPPWRPAGLALALPVRWAEGERASGPRAAGAAEACSQSRARRRCSQGAGTPASGHLEGSEPSPGLRLPAWASYQARVLARPCGSLAPAPGLQLGVASATPKSPEQSRVLRSRTDQKRGVAQTAQRHADLGGRGLSPRLSRQLPVPARVRPGRPSPPAGPWGSAWAPEWPRSAGRRPRPRTPCWSSGWTGRPREASCPLPGALSPLAALSRSAGTLPSPARGVRGQGPSAPSFPPGRLGMTWGRSRPRAALATQRRWCV